MNPNQKNTIENQIERRTDKTTNYEGGLAFEPSMKLKLYLQVATWLVGEPKFYKDSDDDGNQYENQDNSIISLIQTVAKQDPQFVLKLAIYARTQLYLRTAPQVMLVECSLINEAKPYVRKAAPKIILRPDELATCVAYLQSKVGNIGNASPSGSMPAALKRGLADAFVNFTEYQLQKYNNLRKSVKLVDVLRLVHPKPKDDKQSDMFKRLIQNNLQTPQTWETIISDKGSNRQSWLRAAKIMPYMATLRNLRNLMQNDALTQDIITRLTDREKIAKSKQFPFRFFSAYREIQDTAEGFDKNTVLAALDTALNLSIDNIPKLKGNTFLSADNSGSMGQIISTKSKVTYENIANLFMAMSSRFCEKSIASIFGDNLAIVPMPLTAGAISNMMRITNGMVGYSTNGWLIFDYLLQNNIKADRIIIFSDMQMYDSRYSHYQGMGESLYKKLLEYKRKINPDVIVYSFDLAGYGSIQIPEDQSNVVQIAGFSDKIFQFMQLYESDRKSALNQIEEMNITAQDTT